MQVADCMRTRVYTIGPEATLGEAIDLMAHHRVATLPVVDEANHLLGVVVMDDILGQFIPRYFELLRTADFIHDYSFMETGRPPAGLTEKPLKSIMRPPYSVAPDNRLMAALMVMHKHQVPDAPVVDADKRLIGLVSIARVGGLFLAEWLGPPAAGEKSGQ